MIENNSGKVFIFKLDHNFGYGFAEAYDFTDVDSFSGRFIFVYNLIVADPDIGISLENVSQSGIALGPITLFRYPNVRGKGAWKLFGKNNSYIIDSFPAAKSLRANPFLHDDWSKFDKWFISSDDHDPLKYFPYESVRRMETRVLISKEGVVKQFTMKHIIDSGLDICSFYDLTDLGTRNMFVGLVNTYYSQERVEELLMKLTSPTTSRQPH